MEPFISCPADPNASAESYLMNRMLPNEFREYQEHLAQCPRCAEIVAITRARLPVSRVHLTEDGPVHLWASPDKDGGMEGENLGPATRRSTPLPNAGGSQPALAGLLCANVSRPFVLGRLRTSGWDRTGECRRQNAVLGLLRI